MGGSGPARIGRAGKADAPVGRTVQASAPSARCVPRTGHLEKRPGRQSVCRPGTDDDRLCRVSCAGAFRPGLAEAQKPNEKLQPGPDP